MGSSDFWVKLRVKRYCVWK